MTIAFTGGETGGHFYPIIAIAEAINDLVREEHLLPPKLYFLAPTPFDPQALFENGIAYIKIPSGKIRRYGSIANFLDLFVTLAGIVVAFFRLFGVYPDVLISKGGYGSVPSVLAAWLLRIPIIVHESDAKPGRANLLGARFATRIAISFDESARYFKSSAEKKIARTGIPVRKELLHVETEGARQYLGLEAEVSTVLILGGSLGARRINEVVVEALPELVSFANVIHQTGNANYSSVAALAKIVLENDTHKERYHPVNYLTALAMRQAAGASTLIVSRAGSGAITEIAVWKKPAILIPIPESVSHDQRANAYAFAKTGAAVVLEEANLTPHLLASEAKRIAENKELAKSMGERGNAFAALDAARILGKEALAIALSHES